MTELNGKLYGQGLVAPLAPASRGPLNDRFLMAPFSVWNTREGFWQDRKRRWLSLGIQSETGRDDKLTFNIPIYLSDGSTGNKIRAQTSIFDPVVCELCYSWWCRPGGVIVDPFAGGSVRGIVASVLGYRYWGCDLRADQVAANRDQVGPTTRGNYRPKWVCGDSLVEVPSQAPQADFIFSCPPYGNLECYSEDTRDLSTMPYRDFNKLYNCIIAAACAKLKNDRFACFVVANFRDKDPRDRQMRDLVGDTIRAFQNNGLELYNEIILVNAVGSAAMRANNTFIRGHRKVVKSHQNILVFLKGDAKTAADTIPRPPGFDKEEETGETM